MSSSLTKAMILAAGYGTRLKPHTDTLPKALIPYNGKPMIQNVIDRLTSAGIDEITVNTHYFADKMKTFLENGKFGAKINISYENVILGTGGAIKNARKYFHGSQCLIVHNADVDSAIDIGILYDFHVKHNALASLCVKSRTTSRPLLKDSSNELIGRSINGKNEFSKVSSDFSETAFCGVYVLSVKAFDLFPDDNVFDVIPFLLDTVKKGEKVVCYDIGNTYWKDLGKIEDLGS